MIEKIKAEIERLERERSIDGITPTAIDTYHKCLKDTYKTCLKWAEEVEENLYKEFSNWGKYCEDKKIIFFIEKEFHGGEE